MNKLKKFYVQWCGKSDKVKRVILECICGVRQENWTLRWGDSLALLCYGKHFGAMACPLLSCTFDFPFKTYHVDFSLAGLLNGVVRGLWACALQGTVSAGQEGILNNFLSPVMKQFFLYWAFIPTPFSFTFSIPCYMFHLLYLLKCVTFCRVWCAATWLP